MSDASAWVRFPTATTTQAEIEKIEHFLALSRKRGALREALGIPARKRRRKHVAGRSARARAH